MEDSKELDLSLNISKQIMISFGKFPSRFLSKKLLHSVVLDLVSISRNQLRMSIKGLKSSIKIDTAFQSLYLSQKLARPDNPIKNDEHLLIWGGSTSVGMYAIQLAKLSGYTVIATSSPANFDL